MFFENSFHFISERWQETFGLRHRQRTGRERHAGHRVFTLRLHRIHQSVIARQLLDLRFLAFRHTSNDQVLVGGDAEIPFVDLRDLQQAGFQRTARIIQDTAVFNKQRQVPVIVDPFYPTNTIAATGELVRADRLKFNTRATLHFLFERVDTNAFKRVFGFGVFTIGTVTPVALRCHHSFCYRQGVLQRQEAELACGAGVGFLIAVLNR